jgi:hypothetical protein
MKTIPLTQNKFAIVDDEDYVILKNVSWCANNSDGRFYAIGHIDGKRVQMHRFVCRADKKYSIDHINGNTLDNRKENLRACTWSENARNSKLSSKNKSGFKGVEKTKSGYVVRIGYLNKKIHVGSFRSAEEAASAYDEAASMHFGEFARTNKSLGLLN